MDETRLPAGRQGPMTKRELKTLRKMEKYESVRQGSGSNLVKWAIIALGSLLFLAFFGFIIFSIKQSKNKPVEISSTGWIRGSENAKTTLVEFGDFQCPACRAAEPFVRQALHDFDGKIKLHFKHFPLTSIHSNAMLAARAAEAAGVQGKFWQMHDWLYDNQDLWAPLNGSEARQKMIDVAKKLKVDSDKFTEDLDNSTISDKIAAMQNEAINIGVNATPTFYINNKKVESNPASYEEFKQLIQAEVDRQK